MVPVTFKHLFHQLPQIGWMQMDPQLWNRGGFYWNDKARSLQMLSDGFPQALACSVFSLDLEDVHQC